jgi:hypothetical protein
VDERRGLTRAALLDRMTHDEERQLAIVERPGIGQTYTHLLVLNWHRISL